MHLRFNTLADEIANNPKAVGDEILRRKMSFPRACKALGIPLTVIYKDKIIPNPRLNYEAMDELVEEHDICPLLNEYFYWQKKPKDEKTGLRIEDSINDYTDLLEASQAYGIPLVVMENDALHQNPNLAMGLPTIPAVSSLETMLRHEAECWQESPRIATSADDANILITPYAQPVAERKNIFARMLESWRSRSPKTYALANKAAVVVVGAATLLATAFAGCFEPPQHIFEPEKGFPQIKYAEVRLLNTGKTGLTLEISDVLNITKAYYELPNGTIENFSARDGALDGMHEEICATVNTTDYAWKITIENTYGTKSKANITLRGDSALYSALKVWLNQQREFAKVYSFIDGGSYLPPQGISFIATNSAGKDIFYGDGHSAIMVYDDYGHITSAAHWTLDATNMSQNDIYGMRWDATFAQNHNYNTISICIEAKLNALPGY